MATDRLSDPAVVSPMPKVARIDDHANMREHLTRDGCLTIWQRDRPAPVVRQRDVPALRKDRSALSDHESLRRQESNGHE